MPLRTTTTAHPDREIERAQRRTPDQVFASELASLLEGDEGFRKKRYKDTRGIWTIGFGTNIDGPELDDEERAIIGDGTGEITEEQGRVLMQKDIGRVFRAMDQDFGDKWRQWPHEAKLAAASMGYQLGETRFDGFKKMQAALRRGDFRSAAREVRNSKYARDKDTRPRALRMARLFDQAARSR